MAGKQSIENQIEEELVEAQALFDNAAEEISKIETFIDSQEALDRKNDVMRREVMDNLLSVIRSLDCNDTETANKFTHTAIQRLNAQAAVDFKDDEPRAKARILLAVLRQRAIDNRKHLRRLTERWQAITHPETPA
jgi:hypothetical protein